MPALASLLTGRDRHGAAQRAGAAAGEPGGEASNAAVWHSPELLAEVLFIPLLAGWAIWIGQAISSKASDIRVAQQLGTLAGLPPVALTLLMSFQVINSTLILAASLAGALLVIDCAAYLLVSKLFDRERLVTGTKPSSGRTGLGRRSSEGTPCPSAGRRDLPRGGRQDHRETSGYAADRSASCCSAGLRVSRIAGQTLRRTGPAIHCQPRFERTLRAERVR